MVESGSAVCGLSFSSATRIAGEYIAAALVKTELSTVYTGFDSINSSGLTSPFSWIL